MFRLQSQNITHVLRPHRSRRGCISIDLKQFLKKRSNATSHEGLWREAQTPRTENTLVSQPTMASWRTRERKREIHIYKLSNLYTFSFSRRHISWSNEISVAHSTLSLFSLKNLSCYVPVSRFLLIFCPRYKQGEKIVIKNPYMYDS